MLDTVANRRLDSVALIAGTVVSGAAVYAVSIVGIRAYGTTAFAPVSVLWAFWAMLVAVLTFPIQHWIIHRMAADGSEDAVRAAVPRIAAAAFALAAALGALAWLGGERLFGDRRAVWPLLLGLLTIGTGLTGVARGVLSGRDRFRSVAAVIAAENVVRLAACAAVVVADGSVEAFGLAFAGGAACVAAWPRAFRFTVVGVSSPPTLARFIGGLGSAAILAQVVLNAGPVVMSAMGGIAHEVTSLFVTMALFRAPYVVALGLSVQLTGPVTRMVAAGEGAALRRLIRRTAAATLLLGWLAGLIGLAAGVPIVELIYGSGSAPDAGVVAVVASGSALALGTLGLSVILAAPGATSGVAAAWAAAVLAAAVVLAVSPTEPIVSVALGFLAAELVALIALLVCAGRPAHQDGVRVGHAE
jgi:O-antigen/teichoic acid export membrane protein